MAGTLTAPTPGSAQDFGAEAHFVLTGTGTENDGKAVRVSAGIDPVTGLPVAPGTTTIVSAKGTMTNRSGTIATGGVARTLATANAGRSYLLIQNPSTATASIWIDFAGVAAVLGSPSVELGPGTTLIYEGTWLPTGAITVNAASAGAAYTAKEG